MGLCGLVGPTCDGTDVFAHDYELPQALEAGDRLVFGLAGAYAACCATPFNGFPPPALLTVP